MHFVSKRYANKSIKIYDMMQKELEDIVSELENAKYYIEQLKKDVENLEREKIVKYDYETFDLRVKNLRGSIAHLDSFRRYIKINNANLKKALENDKLVDREISLEDLQDLYNQTQFMINNVAETMDSLRMVRLDVDSLNLRARNVIERPNENYKIIYEIMESVYSHSKEAQIRIDQLSDTMNLKIREGSLNDIMRTDAILKANIDLKKKKTEGR